jgi:APA family basic amino acid/polyamine antiporter
VQNEQPKQKLGLLMTTSLVVGNMIGSGIFLIPASLAAFGGIGILGWLFSALGAITIAIVFGYLNERVPNAQGGPYAYTREAYGEFPAFLVAWGYWISIWCTNAAIAVALVSYLSVFFPILSSSSLWSISTGIGFIWLLSWVNTLKIRNVGWVQLLTTLFKITPLLVIGILGIVYFDPSHFEPFNRTEDSNWQALTACTTLTLFAFLGIESATIPQNHIENPKRTIRLATIFGTLITTLIYMLGSFAVMSIIPPETLQQSEKPFAEAGAIIGGDIASYLVAIGAVIATFGALNGWLLLQGQIPLAATKDGLFPKFFGITNKNGAPVWGIVFSSILATILMALNFHKSTIDAFTFMMLLSTLNVLVPYLFSSSASIILQSGKRKTIIAGIAFLFSLWMIIGCGAEVVYYGFVLLMAGIPFYIWMRKTRSK